MKEKKRVPLNTSREAQENPMIPLAEGQEAQGQQSLVNSDTLPTDMGRYSNHDVKAILEAAGVKFLGEVEGDSMFQYVELPAGWKKVSTDHSMWSKLVDDKDRERAMIFYKAAFYDRSAHLSLSRRYGYYFDYDRYKKEGVGVSVVTDCGKTIHTTELISASDRKRYEVSDEANEVAEAWLSEHYPNWQDPSIYWD